MRRIDRLNLDATSRANKREDKQRQTTRDLRTRAAKYTEIAVKIFQHFL